MWTRLMCMLAGSVPPAVKGREMKVMMRMMTTAMTGGCLSAAASSPSSLIYCRILRRRGAAFPFHRSTSSIATLLLPCERYSVHTRASLLDGRHLHKSYAFVGTSGKVSAMSGASKARGPEFQSPRQVVKKVLSKPQYDGDGAVVRRSIGRPELRNLDPFLMLDEFSVTAPAGFPDHPHRGFETVTYMLQGSFTHQDFAGHKGTIGPGDLQWMTAGRGIIHSEMPAGEGANTGLQLWINLSSKDKMIEPRYQELQSKDISRVEEDGVEVRIIAGEAFGVKSPVYTRTPTMYLDFTMKPGAEVRQPVPEGWNAFIYVLEGEGVFGAPESSPVAAHHTLVLGAGNGLIAWNRSEESLRFVLIGGQPLNEPVVQHGPFVMNTKAEIEKTIEDYHFSRNGFEKARHWKSQPLMP